MTTFQIILLVAIALFAILTVAGRAREALSLPMTISLVALWIAGGLVTVAPDLATRLASLVGIGRGADLVLYCGLMGTVAGFFLMYLRLRRLQRDITLLVRHLALREAREGEQSPPGG